MIEFLEKNGVIINIICGLIVQITIVYVYFVFFRFRSKFEKYSLYESCFYQMKKREYKELQDELILNSMPLTYQVQDIRDRLRIIDEKCNTVFNNLEKFRVDKDIEVRD
jgi:hypothetical protein